MASPAYPALRFLPPPVANVMTQEPFPVPSSVPVQVSPVVAVTVTLPLGRLGPLPKLLNEMVTGCPTTECEGVLDNS